MPRDPKGERRPANVSGGRLEAIQDRAYAIWL
jgi:hypothetical protein